MQRLKYILISLSCIFSTDIVCQENTEAFTNPTLYTTSDGLLSNQIYKVTEDQHGFIWLGNHEGVSRFDGALFTNFTDFHEDGEVKKMGPIIDLKIDTFRNQLWASGDQGVFVSPLDKIFFQRYNDVFQIAQEGFQDRVEKMLFDGPDRIWFANYLTGMHMIDLANGEKHAYEFENSKVHHMRDLNTLKDVVSDLNKKTLWIATTAGLIEFDKESQEYNVHFYNEDPANGVNDFKHLSVTEDRVFVGTGNDGLVIFDKSEGKFTRTREETFAENYISTRELYKEDKHSLWVTVTSGLLKYNLLEGKLEDTLSNNPEKNILYGLSLIDSRGIKWYASNYGLFRYNQPSNIQSFISLENYGSFSAPMEIKKIKFIDGFYYAIGIRSTGLYQIDSEEKAVTKFSYDEVTDYNLRDMAVLDEEHLIIVSHTKLLKFNLSSQTFENIPLPGLPDDPIFRSIASDGKGLAWFGSNMYGLFEYNSNTNKVRSLKNAFNVHGLEKDRMIQKLFLDQSNHLWIGKGTRTVLDITNDSLHYIPQKQEVSSFKVAGNFEEDNHGKIWVAGLEDGLGYYNFNEFNKGINKTISGHFSDVYTLNDTMLLTVGDGLGIFHSESGQHKYVPLYTSNPTIEFTGPLEGNGKGQFLIGCNNGAAVFDTSIFNQKAVLTIPYLAQIKANGESVYEGGQIEKTSFNFQPGTKHLNIRFSQINFNENLNNRVQFKLEDNWLPMEDHWVQNFSNVTPGLFKQEIRIINEQDEEIFRKKYSFKVDQYWYLTGNMWALYTLIGLSLIVLIARSRILRLQKEREEKRINKFKNNFYANITHEFRTPLTVINGMADELQQNITAPDNQKINLIKRNSQQLLKLINQLLEITKMKSGKSDIHWAQGNIVDLLKIQTSSLESLAKIRNISLQFYSEEKEIVMDYDVTLIEKIINNLLSNALKFTEEYGKVLLTCRTINQDNISFLEMKVIDSGIGIDEKHLPHIFDRFAQYEPSDMQQGSGIGLSIVNEIVELLSGTIKVESERGEGTTFFVQLPIMNNAPYQKINTKKGNQIEIGAALPVDISEAMEKPVLFIVEDNVDIQYYLKEVLDPQFHIHAFANGQEALQGAFELIPDIIISDVMMPYMDGFEFCQRIKKDPKTNHVPIILLTAKATSHDKIRGLEYGADAYMMKPFEKKELVVRLTKLLENRKVLQEKYSKKLLLSKDTGSAETPTDTFIIRVNQYILDHLSDLDFDTGRLIAHLNLSRSQVHRKIKTITGLSTANYIKNIRLHKAKELLLQTDRNISEICYDVGFKSPAYFSQSFKEKFDMSPSDARA